MIARWFRHACLHAILPSLSVIAPRAQWLPVAYRAAIGFEGIECADPRLKGVIIRRKLVDIYMLLIWVHLRTPHPWGSTLDGAVA
jgi:hypothetical protein